MLAIAGCERFPKLDRIPPFIQHFNKLIINVSSRDQVSVVGPYSEEEIAERQRQFKWERSEIDYMGTDSFVNILRRLDESIYGPWDETIPEPPSPMPSVVTLTPSSVRLLAEVEPCSVEYMDKTDEERDQRITTVPVSGRPTVPRKAEERGAEEEAADKDSRPTRPSDDVEQRSTVKSEKEETAEAPNEEDEGARKSTTLSEDDKRRSTASQQEQKEDARLSTSTPPENEKRASTTKSGEDEKEVKQDDDKQKTEGDENQRNEAKADETEKKEDQ